MVMIKVGGRCKEDSGSARPVLKSAALFLYKGKLAISLRNPKIYVLGPRVPKISKSGQNPEIPKSGPGPRNPEIWPRTPKTAKSGPQNPGSRDPENGQISGSPGPFFFWPGPQISLKFPNLLRNPGPYLWIQLKPSSRKVCFFPGSGTPENPEIWPRKPRILDPGPDPRFARFRPDPGSGRNWDPPRESPNLAKPRNPGIPRIPRIPRIPEKYNYGFFHILCFIILKVKLTIRHGPHLRFEIENIPTSHHHRKNNSTPHA